MIRTICLTLVLLASSANCATLTPLPQPRKPVAHFDATGVKRVVVIVLENGNPTLAAQQSFMKDRAAEGMVLTNYFGVAHPSQPNYVALISGSTVGALTDQPIALTRPHLGDVLGTRWRVYADDYPAIAGKCNLIKQKVRYVRRHVPFLSFVNVQKGTCDQIVRLNDTGPVSALEQDITNGTLPSFALIIPNLEHDGHEPHTVTDANTWLKLNIAPLLKNKKLTEGTVFVLTFDEDDTSSAKSNKIFTVLWGDHVKHGTSGDEYNHYDLLATIGALLGVSPPPIVEPDARPFGGIWK